MPPGEREPSQILGFVERLFDLPVERWIAWARLALSGIALSAIYFDVSSSSGPALRALLITYLFLCRDARVRDSPPSFRAGIEIPRVRHRYRGQFGA